METDDTTHNRRLRRITSCIGPTRGTSVGDCRNLSHPTPPITRSTGETEIAFAQLLPSSSCV